MTDGPQYAEGWSPVTYADPTKITILTDPISQRMSGVAVHGNISFDVPFISEVVPGLWQGGCETGLILPTSIKNLVSLYPWESYEVTHELDSSLVVRMFDSSSQAFDQIDDIAHWVNSVRKSGPTLVHCQAGLNRSSLVVTRALMLAGMSATTAIDLIKNKRSQACLCNRSFTKWLVSQ